MCEVIKMKRTRSLPSTPKKIRLGRVPNSPSTPLKQGRRKLEQKDSFCLCCGVCLIGAKSTFNVCTCERLLDQLQELTETSINLNIRSTRVCKTCCRRVDSLHRRSKVLQLDLEEFRGKFKNRLDDVNGDPGSTKSYFKRAAKESPMRRQQKRPRNVQLSFEDINVPILNWNVFHDEENQSQAARIETPQRPTQEKFSVQVLIKGFLSVTNQKIKC